MEQSTAAAASGRDTEYETIYVLRPDVEKQRAEDVATRMNDVIAKSNGKLTRVENWGRRVLAYPVARHKRGVYVYLRYVGRGGIVAEIERNLRLLDTVIKFQTVKVAEAVAIERVEVVADDIRFEHVEAPTEEEEDISLARELGLEADPNAPLPREEDPADADEAETEGDAAEGETP